MDSLHNKTAYYSGVFDPPHQGHFQLACHALQQFGFEKLIIIPSYQPPHKQPPYLPFSQRVEALHTLFDAVSKVEISSIESELTTPSYTIETLKAIVPHFESADQSIPFLIGADALEKIESWHQAEMLCQKVCFIVAPRDGINIETLATQIKYPIAYQLLNMHEIAESSSSIKAKI